jgi:hypothetical protein
MVKRIKLYYIGWRGNPQLKNGGYYKAFGQLSKAEAKRKEQTSYGSMSLTAYETEEQYMTSLRSFKEEGHSINF